MFLDTSLMSYKVFASTSLLIVSVVATAVVDFDLFMIFPFLPVKAFILKNCLISKLILYYSLLTKKNIPKSIPELIMVYEE